MSKSLHEAIQQVAELKMPKTNRYGEYTSEKIRKAAKAGSERARDKALDQGDRGEYEKASRSRGRSQERRERDYNMRARADADDRARRAKKGQGPRPRKGLLAKARGLLGRGLDAAAEKLGDSVQHNAPVINEREDPHVAADPLHPANRGGRGGSGRPATYHVDVDGVKYHSQLPYMSKDGKMHGPGE